ncbi:hypothetical protein [Marinimicrobium locisalis]|uniref:hypothetical protein n=1 Tax=Marinimicrobium locisalis TaxID=546022 RepID=UPI003221B997
MRRFSLLLAISLMMSCAKGSLDVLDRDDNVIGECSANFYWHWRGAQASVDYLLYVCAQEHIDKGYRVSDESVLKNDYTLPKVPKGASWNKSVARTEFKKENISEREYGYILAAIEYEYFIRKMEAKEQLEKGFITKVEYEQLLLEAESDYYGE